MSYTTATAPRPRLQIAPLPFSRILIGLLVASWIGIVIVPLVGVLLYSVFKVRQFTLTSEFDLSQFTGMAHSGRWSVIGRTLKIGAIVTAIDLALAFPFAFWLAKVVKSPGTKAFILTLAVVPFFLSVASRTIVWRPLLSSNGLLNTLLINSGLRSEPLEFLFTEAAVVGGLAVTYFPSMLFPIFLAISLIDDDYLAAARDLGATPMHMARTIIVPLALPGIVAGVVFTLVPVLGDSVVPQLLGGGSVNLLSRSVISAIQSMSLNVAAAMCTVIFACLGVLLLLLYLSFRPIGGAAQLKGFQP